MAAGRRGTEDITARMLPALTRVMAPDDKVVASTIAFRTMFLASYLVIMMALLLGFFAAVVLAGVLSVAVPILVAGGLLNLVWVTGQLSLFLAVTEQQVICYGVAYRLVTLAARPSRLVLSAPRPAVTATPGHSGPLGRRLRITAPGVSLDLLIGTRADLRPDAAQVITALQAGTTGHPAD
jgi:hypothetical protein